MENVPPRLSSLPRRNRSKGKESTPAGYVFKARREEEKDMH